MPAAPAIAALMGLVITISDASSAPAPAWVGGIAQVLSDASGPPLTNLDLADRFAPFITFAAARCKTMRLPEPGSTLPIESALIAYENDNACDQPTPLQVLQIRIKAPAQALSQLKMSLARRLPTPCFAGALPAQAGRRAPQQRLVAWRMGRRLVGFAQEAGIPDRVALSLVIVADAGSAPSQSLRDEMAAGFPDACR